MTGVDEVLPMSPDDPPAGTERPSRRRIEGGLRLTDPGRCRTGGPGHPLVSYVTVVRNAKATLRRTLDSVRTQQWREVEHIVVDGLSDDGTRDVIEAHAGQIDYYLSEPDAGLYDALNKALTHVRGDLVCVLNADDWLTPEAAAVAARALVSCSPAPGRAEPVMILTSAWLHAGRRRKLWPPAPLNAGSWLRCPKICHNGVYATPAALTLAGPYDSRYRIVGDTRWLCTAFDAGVRFVSCAAPTVHYMSGGLSSDTRRHVEECARLVAERFPALSALEVWTLVHGFYPWPDNLAPFAATCPDDLGRSLETLLANHAGDEALLASAMAAGLAEQRGHPRRVRARRSLSTQLQRGGWRTWYGLREVMAPPRPRLR
ncbi:MAG: glycosyltransferase [Betaproteobacteria bacterium]|nr:glycosyltransferase [Betaproteobacteria bacterium]